MSSKVLSGSSQAIKEPPWLAAGPPAESKDLHGDQESAAREQRAREEGRREGYEEGYREGHAQAFQQASQAMEQECATILSRAMADVEQTVKTRYRLRRQMEEDLLKLAVTVARRILNRELSVDPEALLGVVKAVVARIEARDVHRLRVAPSDCGIIERRLAELSLPARVEVTADPALPRGSLHLESSRGELDASVGTQLEEIDRGLTDLVRRSP